MIGLDSNVLARYVIQDDPEQAELAGIAIEEKCSVDDPGFVSLMVIC